MPRIDDGDSMARDAALIGVSQNEPLAFDVRVSAASAAAHVMSSWCGLRRVRPPSRRRPIPSDESFRRVATVCRRGEARLWTEQVHLPWSGTGAIARVSWLPAKLGEVMGLLREVQEMTAGRAMMTGRVGTARDGDHEPRSRCRRSAISRLRKSILSARSRTPREP